MKKYKVIIFLFAICALFTTANSQWLETTISVDSEPCALVYNSTNNKVYCANRGSDNLTIIDGANNSIITTVSVGDFPCALVWNSIQNRTYVANLP